MNKIWLEQYPKSVPATIDVAAHASLVELLEAAFASHGQKVAYTFMGKSLTFAEVDTWSRALGAYLQSLGLRRGDRVAIMMPNVPQYPVAVAGHPARRHGGGERQPAVHAA
jgi:long-chain acyl-CoA synthetase